MDQSSRDHTLLDLRPSPGPGRGAVSRQSSRDKHRKRSLPGSTVRREGRAISTAVTVAGRAATRTAAPLGRLLAAELRWVLRRPRTLVVLGLLALVPLAVAIGVATTGGPSSGRGPGLVAQIAGNGFVLPVVALGLSLTLLLPLAVAAAAARPRPGPCAGCCSPRPPSSR